MLALPSVMTLRKYVESFTERINQYCAEPFNFLMRALLVLLMLQYSYWVPSLP